MGGRVRALVYGSSHSGVCMYVCLSGREVGSAAALLNCHLVPSSMPAPSHVCGPLQERLAPVCTPADLRPAAELPPSAFLDACLSVLPMSAARCRTALRSGQVPRMCAPLLTC